MARFACDGASLAWARAGSGPTLLLLHGGLSDSEADFGTVVPRLAARFDVITLDTRGHGYSSWGGGLLSYPRFAEDAASLLTFLGVTGAMVMGLSDGGISGFHLALRHPRLVRRLIAIGASADISGDTPHAATAIRRYTAAQFAVEHPLMLARWRSRSPHPEQVLPVVTALLEQVWRPPVYLTREELSRIRVATAIVMGEDDEYVTVEHARALRDAIPGSLLELIPGCRHLIFESNPAEAWRVIDRLLDG